jgi:hypothetical protein
VARDRPDGCTSFAGDAWLCGPGSVRAELFVVEQRYRAVLAVVAGESVTEVAAQVGVARQTVGGQLPASGWHYAFCDRRLPTRSRPDRR